MRQLDIHIGLSFLLVLIATIVPLPHIVLGARPLWVLILLLYLQFYQPHYCNLLVLLIMGLFLDVLLSTVLGEHALAVTLVIWIASNQTRRFYLFSIGQQLLLIGFFCLLYQLILYTIDAFLGLSMGLFSVIASSVSSVLFWPWLRLLAEEFFWIKPKSGVIVK